MKKLIFILFLTIFEFTLNAQAKSTLIFGDAITKDKNMERIGTVLIVIGGVTLFTGNILYWKIYNESRERESSGGKAGTYRCLMFGGLGLMTVGIPLWAIGKSKERHIRIDAELVRFKGLASANGVGLKIRF
ncbi:MAG: hypothetical protein WA816_05505 [Bacteroidales bacterium]